MLDSRTTTDAVRRRRNCNSCKRRFTTYEKLGAPNLKVVKRSQRSEPFDESKLRTSLERVCSRRPNVGKRDIDRIVRAVETRLLAASAKSVRSSTIVDLVLEFLSDVDTVAHNRMAANYIDENGDLRTDGRPQTDGDDAQTALFPDDS